MTMQAEQLRALQAPLKNEYREHPGAALITLRASGRLGEENISCRVDTGRALLEALVACAGVTLKAVATALSIPLRGGTVRAEGDLDFRGTLGVDKAAPVGFKSVRLSFELDTDAGSDELARLVSLTERYCVIYQTLRNPPAASVIVERGA